MIEKHLNGTGRGEFLYDFEHDILMFKINDRDYEQSEEFQNFTADIDSEGFVTGMRIFDASKVLDLDKYILNNIKKWKFKSIVENGMITLKLSFLSKVEDEEAPLENFTQQLTSSLVGHKLIDSSVECATA